MNCLPWVGECYNERLEVPVRGHHNAVDRRGRPPSLRVVAERRYSRTPPILFSIDLDSIDYH